MVPACAHKRLRLVAPLAGSVDRNKVEKSASVFSVVAPLAGSVDRNSNAFFLRKIYQVAPLAGSVDRNMPLSSAPQIILGRSPRGERG